MKVFLFICKYLKVLGHCSKKTYSLRVCVCIYIYMCTYAYNCVCEYLLLQTKSVSIVRLCHLTHINTVSLFSYELLN